MNTGNSELNMEGRETGFLWVSIDCQRHLLCETATLLLQEGKEICDALKSSTEDRLHLVSSSTNYIS